MEDSIVRMFQAQILSIDRLNFALHGALLLVSVTVPEHMCSMLMSKVFDPDNLIQKGANNAQHAVKVNSIIGH